LARANGALQAFWHWQEPPDGPVKIKAAVIGEMESFAINFRDQQLFLSAFLSNGHYYYNNNPNDIRAKQFPSYLWPNEPDDAWVYD